MSEICVPLAKSRFSDTQITFGYPEKSLPNSNIHGPNSNIHARKVFYNFICIDNKNI